MGVKNDIRYYDIGYYSLKINIRILQICNEYFANIFCFAVYFANNFHLHVPI